MILLRIVCIDELALTRIAKLLLEEKLVVDANVTRNVERLYMEDGALVATKVHLLSCKTKALLYPKIEERVNKDFGEVVPEIYSLPIVNMNWAEKDKIANTVRDLE